MSGNKLIVVKSSFNCLKNRQTYRNVYVIFVYNGVACRDSFVGKDRKANNETTPLLGNRFLISKNWTATIKLKKRNGVFYAVHAEML
jgi:5-formaminoimidazole-4-carboxamide-1-beta-D-ribofuranosyl 5'-monophosphate synthetase